MSNLYHLELGDDIEGVLTWRRDVVETAAAVSVKLQRELVRCCRDDVLFFFKGFVDLFEPRLGDGDANEPQVVPFIPWPHQVEAIQYADQWMGKRDIRVNKSRAQGASYLYSMMFLHRWLFHPMFKVNIVSKDQDAADNPKDPDSILWKIMFALESLPSWMRGEPKLDWVRSVTDHTLTNRRNGSVIRAYACTANVGSGGRAAVFFMDEIAKFPRAYDSDAVTSTQQITRCRIFCSSPYGADGAYFRLMHDPTSRDPIQTLSWMDNPTQNRSLYHVVSGRPAAVDSSRYGKLPNEYLNLAWWGDLKRRLEDRGFDLSKGYRSPWYDNECLRSGANPVSIAQELDLSFTGATAQYFPDSLVDRLLRDTGKPPVTFGELSFTTDDFKPRWLTMPDGRFQLWFHPELGKYAPPDQYVISADVAMGLGGSGGSNSALTVLNRRTMRKVASFVTPNMLPYLFAEMAIAACWWFRNDRGHPAFLVWEANGPGQEFQKRVLETEFRDFYYRKHADVVTKRSTKKPGYWTQKRSELLGPYREALIEGHYVNPDKSSLEELRQYSIGSDGEPFHNGENRKDDPTGAKKAHADRVVADAVGWIAAMDFGRVSGGTVRETLNVMNVTPGNAPLGSYALRRAEYLVSAGREKRKSRW